MAECPKCHEHLKPTDWRQKCPHCGANIVLYDLQERMMLDADKAEVQYYHFQKKIDRTKTAFVGSKLTITRIFTSLLPIVAIFLPLMVVNFKEPFKEFSGNFGALQLFDFVGNFDTKILGELLNNPATKVPVLCLVISIVCVLVGIVIMLLHFLCLIMACGKRARLRNYTLDILYLISAVVMVITISLIGKSPVIEAKLGFGAIIYLILVILNFVIDILVFKENIEVKHAPCFVGGIPVEEYLKMVDDGVPHEEIRNEMYKRLSAMQKEKDEAAAKKKAEIEKAEAEKLKAEQEGKANV